ncbi:hypothetical protein AQ490_23765 [Wenjunlia vitaminophila]|uniref:Uncharacterized protein n=1 Tax=Wenjunlia vitaminophila TaxID=76728 RepID=A0A0T6LRY6_WENVI|nr:hypothetical protein [Wenjunlia vitaminophila]KRV48875.1 hypothetical protein AQ490_23765 [Wenjunlia vitaminophila]
MGLRQQLDREYEQLRAAQIDRARSSPTPAQWQSLVDRYRGASRDHPDVDATRGLARALWRLSMTLHAAGDPTGALGPGRQGVAEFDTAFRRTLDWNADEQSPAVDAVLAELLVARCDLAEAAAAAGKPVERIRILEGAREIGTSITAGPRSLRALGTVYHNLSIAELHRLMESTRQGSFDVDLRAPALSASRAVETRLKAVTPAEPLSIWELANTYIQYLRCLGIAEEPEVAVRVTEQAAKLVALHSKGPLADLRPQLTAAVAMLCIAYPTHARRLGRALRSARPRRPWRRRGI